MYNPDSSEDKQVSTFQLLELACLELAEILYRLKITRVAYAGDLPNGFKPVYRGFVYSRMLWSKFSVIVSETLHIMKRCSIWEVDRGCSLQTT